MVSKKVLTLSLCRLAVKWSLLIISALQVHYGSIVEPISMLYYYHYYTWSSTYTIIVQSISTEYQPVNSFDTSTNEKQIISTGGRENRGKIKKCVSDTACSVFIAKGRSTTRTEYNDEVQWLHQYRYVHTYMDGCFVDFRSDNLSIIISISTMCNQIRKRIFDISTRNIPKIPNTKYQWYSKVWFSGKREIVTNFIFGLDFSCICVESYWASMFGSTLQ